MNIIIIAIQTSLMKVELVHHHFLCSFPHQVDNHIAVVLLTCFDPVIKARRMYNGAQIN